MPCLASSSPLGGLLSVGIEHVHHPEPDPGEGVGVHGAGVAGEGFLDLAGGLGGDPAAVGEVAGFLGVARSGQCALNGEFPGEEGCGCHRLRGGVGSQGQFVGGGQELPGQAQPPPRFAAAQLQARAEKVRGELDPVKASRAHPPGQVPGGLDLQSGQEGAQVLQFLRPGHGLGVAEGPHVHAQRGRESPSGSRRARTGRRRGAGQGLGKGDQPADMPAGVPAVLCGTGITRPPRHCFHTHNTNGYH